IYYTSTNPTAISFAPIETYTDIGVFYGAERGDYHDVDEASKINHFGVEIKGLKKFKRSACFGNIGYYNTSEYDRCWNSALFISPDNPYILADSIKSDFHKEIFFLQGTASYTIAPDWIVGLDLKYLVGSTSDQTDPRSETVGMRFSATPGVTWQLAPLWSIGLAGNIELFKEKIGYTIVNTQRGYTILQFNGMGLYEGISTNSTLGTSYTRNYNGLNYGGYLQLTYSGDLIANLLELSVDVRDEKARDGGKTIAYKGGDYNRTAFGLEDRLSIKGEGINHNITLAAKYKKVKGMWYTQERRIDTQKNNQEYYFVTDSSVTHTEKGWEASLGYRIDLLSSNLPSLSFYVKGDLQSSKIEHTYYDTYYMNYTRLILSAGVDKHFQIQKSLFNLSVNGEYALPILNDDYKVYDASTTKITSDGLLVYTKYDNIPELYTYPKYEYHSSAYAAVGLKVSTQIPLTQRLWLGMSAQARMAFYLGDSVYRDLLGAELDNPLDGSHHFTTRLAISLLF
ncbi:MAG: hypothetical protein LUI04_06990, partial [Porphyromonadaceae bacterium]|nr:hypothetical protein [Porphyromonadaceae bacterium]